LGAILLLALLPYAADGRKRNCAFGAYKQLDIHFALKLADFLAQMRLSDTQPVCCTGERKFVRDSRKKS
jgi:hypothetical protein